MNLLIKNGTVVTHEIEQQADILIENGRIRQIAAEIDMKADQSIDAKNKYVLPGLVDVHVHFRDPGYTNKETIESGGMAAVHGGFTKVLTMPNVQPVPNTPELMASMVEQNKAKSVVSIGQIAPITIDRVQGAINNLSALKEAGAVAFSNDGSGIQDAETMLQAMQLIAKLGVPLAAHVEDESLMKHGVVNKGTVADRLHLPGISELTETAQLARDLELVRQTGVHYHVCHISTKRSVELVRRAKEDGLNVTAEVTPHHLLLDVTMIETDNSMFKMNPPLRTPADRRALLVGLLDGTIDMIATDHAPHTEEDKSGSMLNATFGITGLETSLQLIFTNLVHTKVLKMKDLVNLMSYQPARQFGLTNHGQITEWQPANLTIFDPTVISTIQKSNFYSKGTNSPFIGTAVKGQVQQTIINGKIVYSEDLK